MPAPAAASPVPPEVFAEILRDYRLPLLGVHGLSHWGRVLENGLRLAKETGADRAVVGLFAVFHDARRVNEIVDPGHGRRGAELARLLRVSLPIDDAQLELLADACARHTDGETKGDITVRTCWDADRLDLWRVGITPQPSRLGTDAAREAEILRWSRTRSLEDRVSGVAREWLRWAEPGWR